MACILYIRHDKFYAYADYSDNFIIVPSENINRTYKCNYGTGYVFLHTTSRLYPLDLYPIPCPQIICQMRYKERLKEHWNDS